MGVWLSEVHSSKKVLASWPWGSLLKVAKEAFPENHAMFTKLKANKIKANDKTNMVSVKNLHSVVVFYLLF